MRDKKGHIPRLGMGDAQRLYGLTARALRFYEERGLLRAQRDRLNCRFFDADARWRLGWIAGLRQAGVTLPAVEQVLIAEEQEGRGRQVALAELARRKSLLQNQLKTVEAVSAALAAGRDASDIRPAALRSAA